MSNDHVEHHRDITGGWFRAGSFGINDGLVTNVSLIMGVVGANPGHSLVRLAGLSGLIAGGFSMSIGEFLSMKAQKELLEYEIEVERQALAESPEDEEEELRAIFMSRGSEEDLADRLARDLMRDPDLALRTHAREELGIDPSATGNPYSAAISSLVAFSIGAFVPLVPWLLPIQASDVTLGVTSMVLSTVASLVIGGGIGWFTRRGVVRWALQQTAIAAAAAIVTFAVGRLVGA